MKRLSSRRDFLLYALSVVPICAAATIVTPTAVYAQAGAQSEIAGIGLPKGAARISQRGLSANMGRFLGTNAATNYMKLPAGSGAGEVYAWSGAAYKPGRVGFMRTAVQSALEDAGFAYHELGEVDNTPNQFEEEWGLVQVLDFAPVDGRPTYFWATNDQRKITVVGVWFEQGSQERTVLGLARAGYKAEPRPVEESLPEITGPYKVLVKDNNNAAADIPAGRTPDFPRIAPKPRTVRGMVKDSNGNPVADAEIWVHASAVGGARTSIKGYSNAAGVYEIPLPIGICQVVQAQGNVKAKGKTYPVSLEAADGRFDTFDAAKGHVENMVLRAAGGSSSGVIRINNWSNVDGGIMEVTLTPEGNLLDGSRAYTLVFRFPNRNGGEVFLGGVPAARYTMKTRLYQDGDVLPMRMQATFTNGGPTVEPTTAFTVEFKPKQSAVLTQGSSAFERFEVSLKP